jgi:transcriptional regulator with XRE-family HTH domain
MMTKQAEWFAELAREFENDPEYRVDELKLAFAEELTQMLDQRGIHQAELARRLGTSRAYITRIMKLNFNLTIETMAKIAIALDADLSIHLSARPATNTRAAAPELSRRVVNGAYRRIGQPAVPVVSDKPRKPRSAAG